MDEHGSGALNGQPSPKPETLNPKALDPKTRDRGERALPGMDS